MFDFMKPQTAWAVVAAITIAVYFGSSAHADIKPIIIDNNPGGQVGTFAAFYDALRASGVPVVLRGLCMSACTLILELPKTQVCVEPTASLGFHLAVNGETNVPDPEMTQALIRRYYPSAVQAWLTTKDLSPKLTFMSADEIVALGVFNPCTPPPSSPPSSPPPQE